MGRSRTTGHASSRKGIPVGVRFRETIGERLQERDNLVFFLIGQTRRPVVISILFGTSGLGQQFTFSIVPSGQCPEVTLNAYTSRVL